MASAEDPRRAFPDAQHLQVELLGDVRAALARIAASRSELAARVAESRERLPWLDGQARQSLCAGREELARQALTLREVAAAELAALERQLLELDAEEQRLSLVEQRLATLAASQRARERLVSARYSAAEARVRVNEALAGVSHEIGGLTPALEDAEWQAEGMEARAAAIDSLVASGGLELAASREPALGAAVDRRLELFRRELD